MFVYGPSISPLHFGRGQGQPHTVRFTSSDDRNVPPWSVYVKPSARPHRRQRTRESLTVGLLLQPSVSIVAVSLLVSGLTVDILSTFYGVFVV